MAALAVYFGVRTGQTKTSQIVIKVSIGPGCRVVTASALAAELTCMGVVLTMASDTIRRRTL